MGSQIFGDDEACPFEMECGWSPRNSPLLYTLGKGSPMLMPWVCPSVISVHNHSQLGLMLTLAGVPTPRSIYHCFMYPQQCSVYSVVFVCWQMDSETHSSLLVFSTLLEISSFVCFMTANGLTAASSLSSPALSIACPTFGTCRFSLSLAQLVNFLEASEINSLAVSCSASCTVIGSNQGCISRVFWVFKHPWN